MNNLLRVSGKMAIPCENLQEPVPSRGTSKPSSHRGPCTRFGNNQRIRNNNWQRMWPPIGEDQSTPERRSARTIAEYILRQTKPTLCTQPARVAAPACATCATHSFAQLPQHLTGPSSSTRTRLRHHGCTQCIAIAGHECHNCSVVLRRLRIFTRSSQPETASLSAACKGSIHANSTPIPLQTHGNR